MIRTILTFSTLYVLGQQCWDCPIATSASTTNTPLDSQLSLSSNPPTFKCTDKRVHWVSWCAEQKDTCLVMCVKIVLNQRGETCIDITFSLRTPFVASHKFEYVLFLFSFYFNIFLNFLKNFICPICYSVVCCLISTCLCIFPFFIIYFEFYSYHCV